MTDIERCQYGWERMAQILDVSGKTMRLHKKELLSHGLIRYKIPGGQHKSPLGNKIRKPMVQWFESDIRAWWRAKNKAEYEEKMAISK